MSQTISIVVAMSLNRVIGRDNQLPWNMPSDLAHFKKVTMGKPIIMGRKTFESIGRALPGRQNIVVTRNGDACFDNVECVSSIDDAICLTNNAPEICIIGGAQLIESAFDRVNKIYLSVIDANVDGDVKLFEWDENNWRLEAEEYHAKDDANDYGFWTREFVR